MSEDTVGALADADSIESTFTLCGMGMRGERLVLQCAVETGSAVYVLCYAAPDDEMHDGWFKLDDFDADKEGVLEDASLAAQAYTESHDFDAHLEEYFGVDVEKKRKQEIQF